MVALWHRGMGFVRHWTSLKAGFNPAATLIGISSLLLATQNGMPELPPEIQLMLMEIAPLPIKELVHCPCSMASQGMSASGR
jgi:hypothetical protein